MKKQASLLGATQNITNIDMKEALEERYLAYAMSTIMARSLPDVRDGLKPVHRRILWAMRELNLNASKQPKKSARVVGDVIGKFHPHGDTSVYDAMVRLAQDFSVRYPLVDGQGNFGNIDGDGPAAMRYTEARLTPYAELLMEGLDEHCVDFLPTYDGTEEEPAVMPAGFPNLLANGSTGIAVGMATSIPPHNLGELCDALIILLGNQKNKEELALEKIKGPDFPTGGILVEERDSIVNSYKTGRGSFRLRASWRVEEVGRSWVVVVDQIPYGVKKSPLIEKLADLLFDKKLPDIDNIIDESDEFVRIVIHPKSRNIDPKIMMEKLFKSSDLEIKFPLNLNTLDHTRSPNVISIVEALNQYLTHRQIVLCKRAENRLRIIGNRLEVLEALQKAFLNLDLVIHIIRNEEDAKASLMKKLSLNDRQAEVILETKLRTLRKLEEMELKEESEKLIKEQEKLNSLLASPDLQKKYLIAEVKSIIERFKNNVYWERKTVFEAAPVIDLTDVPVEVGDNVTVVCSTSGWIKTIKGHVDKLNINVKEGDSIHTVLHTDTSSAVILLCSDGKSYTVSIDKISSKGHGDPVRLLVDIPSDAKILAVTPPNGKVLLVSNNGYGFITDLSLAFATRKAGKGIMNLADDGFLEHVVTIDEKDDRFIWISKKDKMLSIPINTVIEQEKGKGVIIDKNGIKHLESFNSSVGLSWINADDKITTIRELQKYEAKRGATGLNMPKVFSEFKGFSK